METTRLLLREARHRCLLTNKRQLSVASSLLKKTGFRSIPNDPYLEKVRKHKRKEGEMTETSKIPVSSEDKRLIEMEAMPTIVLKSVGSVAVKDIPLEKHARAPQFSWERLKQRRDEVKKFVRTLYSIGMIRLRTRKWDPFKPAEFARLAQKHFDAANKAVEDGNEELLIKLSTEMASLTLKKEFKSQNIKWRMLETLERPRVIAAIVAQLDQQRLFAQVVVRIATKQLVAAYDQRGKLVDGDDKHPKGTIDYVVFERQLTDQSSVWRIAGKLPPQQPYLARNAPVVTSPSRVAV